MEYARDLGLLAQHDAKRIANPIYAEVIPRELTWVAQDDVEVETAWYVDAGGGLDVDKLLAAFQQFFREHSEHWTQRFERYQEAGPQLLLQAYLQKVVNGGGRIEREYALGRGRVDLLIVWPQGDRTRRFVVECKVLYKDLERTVEEGLAQTRGYMDRCSAEAGHLIVFDRAPDRTWQERSSAAKRRLTPVAGSPSGACECRQEWTPTTGGSAVLRVEGRPDQPDSCRKWLVQARWLNSGPGLSPLVPTSSDCGGRGRRPAQVIETVRAAGRPPVCSTETAPISWGACSPDCAAAATRICW